MEKISSELLAYESVDDYGLSWNIFLNLDGKRNSCNKGLSNNISYSKYIINFLERLIKHFIVYISSYMQIENDCI